MNFDVQYIDGKRNYWVVRAGTNGEFVEHFILNNCVAISHLDNIDFSNSDLDSDKNKTGLLNKYANHLKEIENIKKRTVISNFHQVNRFINDIKEGDIVITLDARRFVAGVVTSSSYHSEDKIILRGNDGKPYGPELTSKLRINVDWAKPMIRREVPESVKSSLRASMTVFNVTEHWQSINHWLSIFFIKDDTAYFSIRIDQKDKIRHYDVAQFSHIISQVEAVSEILSQNIVGYDDGFGSSNNIERFINDAYQSCTQYNLFNLTTQQSFMSPGDYWGGISGSPIKIVLFSLLISSLFGENLCFAEDSVHVELQRKYQNLVNEFVSSIRGTQNFDSVKMGLVARIPSQKSLPKLKTDSQDKPKDEFTGKDNGEIEGDFPSNESDEFNGM